MGRYFYSNQIQFYSTWRGILTYSVYMRAKIRTYYENQANAREGKFISEITIEL